MTLNELINHFKHNSMKIIILDYLEGLAKILYEGTIGTYKTSVIKNKIGDSEFTYMTEKNNILFIEIFLPSHIKREPLIIYGEGVKSNE